MGNNSRLGAIRKEKTSMVSHQYFWSIKNLKFENCTTIHKYEHIQGFSRESIFPYNFLSISYLLQPVLSFSTLSHNISSPSTSFQMSKRQIHINEKTYNLYRFSKIIFFLNAKNDYFLIFFYLFFIFHLDFHSF